MFVGHYSASFLGKAAAPRAPLWVLLLAAQLVDVAWALLVLLGVERVSLDPTLPSNPLVLEHMPYTHSLVGAFAWAGLAFVVASRLPRLGGGGAASLAIAAVVLSHWVLDLVVHRPDLTLFASEPRLGLALWDRPLLAYGLEIALLAGAAAVYATRARIDGRARRGLVRGIGALVALQTVGMLGPPPSSTTALALMMLTIFLAVAWVAKRAEDRLAVPAQRS